MGKCRCFGKEFNFGVEMSGGNLYHEGNEEYEGRSETVDQLLQIYTHSFFPPWLSGAE